MHVFASVFVKVFDSAFRGRFVFVIVFVIEFVFDEFIELWTKCNCRRVWQSGFWGVGGGGDV